MTQMSAESLPLEQRKSDIWANSDNLSRVKPLIQHVILPFGKQPNNALDTHQITKIRAIFPKCPDILVRPDLSGRVGHQRAVFTINTPTLHGLAQSYSDIFYNLHLLSDKIASQPGFEDKKWRSALLSKVSEKNESQRGFKFHWVFWIESLSGICWF